MFNNENSSNRSGKLFIWPILLSVAVVVPVCLLFLTDIVYPHTTVYSVAVQLNSGERLQVAAASSGAVNKKGDFLIRYDAADLAKFVALCSDLPSAWPYGDFQDLADSWTFLNSDNPYYAGLIAQVPSSRYYSSQTVYDSASDSHQEDTFMDGNGKTVWSYSTQSRTDNSGLFQRVMELSSPYAGRTVGVFTSYINVNQFLAQKYDLNARISCDKKNRLVTLILTGTNSASSDSTSSGANSPGATASNSNPNTTTNNSTANPNPTLPDVLIPPGAAIAASADGALSLTHSQPVSEIATFYQEALTSLGAKEVHVVSSGGLWTYVGTYDNGKNIIITVQDGLISVQY